MSTQPALTQYTPIRAKDRRCKGRLMWHVRKLGAAFYSLQIIATYQATGMRVRRSWRLPLGERTERNPHGAVMGPRQSGDEINLAVNIDWLKFFSLASA